MTAAPALPVEQDDRLRIARLGGPMVLSAVSDVTLPLVVVALLGRMSGDALYIRSLYAPLGLLVVALGTGVGISGQVAVATATGAGRQWETIAIVLSVARVALCAGLVLIAAVYLAEPLLAQLLHVPAGDRGRFASFTRWTVFASLAQLGPVLLAGALRGMGSTLAAFCVSLAAGVLEITVVAVVGLGYRQGVMCVPISIATGAAAATALGLALLARTGAWPGQGRLAWKSEALSELGSVGLPIAAAYVFLFAAGLAQLWVVTPYGADKVAGFSAAVAFQGALIEPAIALGSATAIVLNQRLAESGRHETLRTLRAGLQVTGLLYLVLVPVVWLASGWIARLLSSRPEVSSETHRYLALVVPTLLVQCLVLAALTVMEQCGGGFIALGLNLGYFVAVVAIGALVTRHLGNPVGLYRTVAVANLGSLGALVPTFYYLRSRARSDGASREESNDA